MTGLCPNLEKAPVLCPMSTQCSNYNPSCDDISKISILLTSTGPPWPPPLPAVYSQQWDGAATTRQLDNTTGKHRHRDNRYLQPA